MTGSGGGGPHRLRYAVDPAASRIRVQTRATGMLARLAHDLEIRAGEGAVTGYGTRQGDAWTAEVQVSVAGLRVAGTLRGERLDTGVLSTSDRAEIDRKIKGDVLRGASEVAVRASGDSAGAATIAVGAASQRVAVRPEVRNEADGALTATGRVELSLRALGVAEIKGPLGAFKVSDAVSVLFELRLVPTG